VLTWVMHVLVVMRLVRRHVVLQLLVAVFLLLHALHVLGMLQVLLAVLLVHRRRRGRRRVSVVMVVVRRRRGRMRQLRRQTCLHFPR